MRIGKIIDFIQKEIDEKMETIDVDIHDDTFLCIAKMAHEKDITFNQMVTVLLEEMIEREENANSCSHEHTVSTAFYGNVCKDCRNCHIVQEKH